MGGGCIIWLVDAPYGWLAGTKMLQCRCKHGSPSALCPSALAFTVGGSGELAAGAAGQQIKHRPGRRRYATQPTSSCLFAVPGEHSK